MSLLIKCIIPLVSTIGQNRNFRSNVIQFIRQFANFVVLPSYNSLGGRSSAISHPSNWLYERKSIKNAYYAANVINFHIDGGLSAIRTPFF